MEGLFLNSKENKEKIVIFYIDQDNNVTQRFIRVIDIHDDSIIAYCYWRRQLRTFKLVNILSAGPVKRKATI